MPRTVAPWFVGGWLLLGLAACGDSAPGPSDAGPDLGLDTGADAGLEEDGGDLPDVAPRDAELTDDGGQPSDAGDGGDGGPSDAGPAYLTALPTPEALDGLLGLAGDVKYLAPVVGVPPVVLTEACYFQNMTLYPFHLLFLRSFPGLMNLSNQEYADRVLRRPTRIWWGGGLKRYPATPHPQGGLGVIAWAVYHETAGADRLNADDLLAVQAILRSCVTFAPNELAFLPTDPFQNSFVRAERASLLAQGVPVILPEELR